MDSASSGIESISNCNSPKSSSSSSLASVSRSGKDLLVANVLSRRNSTRKRAKKPVDAPRRPKSAYMFFLAEFREAWKEKHPEQKRVSAVAQAAGEKWRSMTAAEKQRFEDLSNQSKLAYKREMAEYNTRNPPEIRKGNKRPSDAIKRPMSAYLFFLQNFRTAFEYEHPGVHLSAEEIQRLTAEKWRSMTPEERTPYNEMSMYSSQEYKRIKSMTPLERMAAAALVLREENW